MQQLVLSPVYGGPVHVYVGAGYSNRKVAWETFDGSYVKYENQTDYYGAVIEVWVYIR